MNASKRVCFSLLSLFVLCSLCTLLGAPAALARRKNPPRTPLPTDNALSAYVGMAATWQSLIHPNLPTRTNEVSVDVSVYDLTETPSSDNFAAHQLTVAPLPSNADWYVFRPTTDALTLTFDIADTNHRLGKIVLSDIDTGQVIGSLNASADGSSIQGKIKISWQQPYYRIEGYDTNKASLFRLGASQGQSDTYVHFSATGQFAPYRPATVPSARFAGGDDVEGTEGDPYNPNGVSILTRGGGNLSRGCAAKDQVNDASVTNLLQVPLPYLDYIKKERIETVDYTNYRSNDKLDQPSLANDVTAAGLRDTARALSDIPQLPYSDTTGHWHAKFLGNATAFFVVPFRVAQQNGVLMGLQQMFNTLSRMRQGKTDKLAFGLAKAFVTWLSTDSGKQSGFKAGMVIPLGDVKTVETQEDLKATPVVSGLLEEVTFTLNPDIAPPSGMGFGMIELGAATTTPPPPSAVFDTQLTFSSPGWMFTRKLPKGYRYKVSGNITQPSGYQPVNQPIEFLIPGSTAVRIPCKLTAALKFNIYTLSSANPAGPATMNVLVSNAAGQVVNGSSQMQPDGRYLFSVTSLAAGVYTIEVSQMNSGGKWDGSTTVTVQPSVSQDITVTGTYTQNPYHP